MTTSSTPSVAIIVLTWNQRDLTLGCLRSLAAMDYPASRVTVIVVDNGSTDGTASSLRAEFSNLVILENERNFGYAGGNNVGIRYALELGTQYILVLNNDVTVSPGFLEPLLAAFYARPDAGVATPIVVKQTPQGSTVWALGSTVDRKTASVTRNYAGVDLDSWLHKPAFAVDAASGAAMLVKAEIFQHVGLLDEDYFLYFEETDWSLRVRQAGYRILAVPSSLVWHKVSATLGTASPIIDYYMLRNHLRFIGRHWLAPGRQLLWSRVFLRNLLAIVAFTTKSHRGRRLANRNARLLAMRDAILGRWGKMGSDVEAVCYPR